MDAAFAFAQFWLAPLLTLLVSIVYFRTSPSGQGMAERLAVSAHGCVIAVLYFGALTFWWAGASRPAYGKLFAYSLLVPLVLMGFAFVKFRGKASVHLLQIVNLVGLFWTFFVGSMAITGDWL
ncbi:MAG TPA: hypothetical protein VGE70_11430 [Burkholderiaceae bacterium]